MQDKSFEPLLIRPEEVGRLLGLGRATIYQKISSGELPAVRIGRSVRVSLAALRRWVEEQSGARQ